MSSPPVRRGSSDEAGYEAKSNIFSDSTVVFIDLFVKHITPGVSNR